VCALTNPIWLIKTRLALQQRGQLAAAGGAYRGITDAFVRIGRSEGLAGYYKGFGPSLVLVSWGWLHLALLQVLLKLQLLGWLLQSATEEPLMMSTVCMHGVTHPPRPGKQDDVCSKCCQLTWHVLPCCRCTDPGHSKPRTVPSSLLPTRS
jgi:hypothetical protein